MKSDVKKTRGDFGEVAVRDYLEKRGYDIAECNYRKRTGEIDIIACNGGEIAFVEVKTRKFGSMTDGRDAVTREKRRRIVRTANAFLAENPRFRGVNARFDVAEVTVTTDTVPRLLGIEYYEDAFNAALL